MSDFEDNLVLYGISGVGCYLNPSAFDTAVRPKIASAVTSMGGESSASFITSLLYMIGEEYYNDKIAYSDKSTFELRLTNIIARNYQELYFDSRVYSMITSTSPDDVLIVKDGSKSSSNSRSSYQSSSSTESGKEGSNIVQKSASTPTAVNPNNDDSEVSIEITTSEGVTTMDTTEDDFINKYSNFGGKTSGLRLNDVSKSGNISRSNSGMDSGTYTEGGSLLLGIEIYNKLPQDYKDKVLQLVATQFICVY